MERGHRQYCHHYENQHTYRLLFPVIWGRCSPCGFLVTVTRSMGWVGMTGIAVSPTRTQNSSNPR